MKMNQKLPALKKKTRCFKQLQPHNPTKDLKKPSVNVRFFNLFDLDLQISPTTQSFPPSRLPRTKARWKQMKSIRGFSGSKICRDSARVDECMPKKNRVCFLSGSISLDCIILLEFHVVFFGLELLMGFHGF